MDSASQSPPLRRGWTTGACATAACKAALILLWSGRSLDRVNITLPRGETPQFLINSSRTGSGWAEASVIKDAGDDPDVTHGARIQVRVREASKITFVAGDGVGTVTKPGLPIAVGEPAINPVPREMMTAVIHEMAAVFGNHPGVEVTVTIPGGAAIAAKTWNPRLGIIGGLSVLGTTGIVRPFSCAAWIASIHRGIDVAQATGEDHLAGCTGATSQRSVQAIHGLPEAAMIDMGDFAGGMMKYLRRHPVRRLTIGGGIGKMSKLAQGAMDLHSARSQVNFDLLAKWTGCDDIRSANSALHALQIGGRPVANEVALRAKSRAIAVLAPARTKVDIIVIDRKGEIIARA